jgi:hypothetical protein
MAGKEHWARRISDEIVAPGFVRCAASDVELFAHAAVKAMMKRLMTDSRVVLAIKP